MKPQSRKAKGRNLQNWTVRTMLNGQRGCWLHPDDITGRSMGAGGEDILLSPKARKAFPYSIECKSKARFAVYKDYDQAVENAPEDAEPIVVIKANNRRPLVLVDAEYFFNT